MGKMERNEYLEECNILNAGEGNAADKFDKTIILLSAGALGISFSFLSEIKSPPEFQWLLILTWGLLIVSLIVALSNLLVSQISFSKQREILDKLYMGANRDELEENKFSKWTNKLNFVSLSCSIFGIILLSIFSYINLNKFI